MIGVGEALDKAVAPTIRMDFLGNTVDVKKFTLEVSEERKNELAQLLNRWEYKMVYNKNQIQSLIGKLSFITNCVRPGRIFLARLLQALRECPEKGSTRMDEEIRKDVKW